MKTVPTGCDVDVLLTPGEAIQAYAAIGILVFMSCRFKTALGICKTVSRGVYVVHGVYFDVVYVCLLFYDGGFWLEFHGRSAGVAHIEFLLIAQM